MNKNRWLILSAAGALVAALAAALSPSVPARAQGNAATAKLAAPLAVARFRGGVHYDPSLSLDATVKARFDEKNPPAGSLAYDVTFKGGDGVVVPAIFMAPKNAKSAPCIILLHGLGGNKEQMFIASSFLAAKGFATIAIDVAGHGARPRYGGKAAADLNPIEMHQLGAQTIADLGRTVDWLDTRPEVDPQRIGFLGVSLGGILGAVFISDEPRIQTAVLWAAGADWGKLISSSSLTTGKPEARAAGAAEKIEAVMSDVDPLTTIHAFSPRPLLFINGDKDVVVPPACTKELTDAAGEPKKLIVLPGGHIPDISTMLADSISWFETHLKP